MSINSKDLDLWARALGASNDAEAMAALKKMSASMLVIGAEFAKMRQQLSGGGVPEHDPVMEEIFKAASTTMDASIALARVRAAFARHERGAA
ncbi:hypothetical protein ACIO3S_20895 [Nocardioides sp. NPDC087217]|uniref:hypothetical protein n=1 Tax=Nocardioides sp. NPDC087217 TaxID=3364335 RepID=UPI00381AC68E